MEKELLDKIGSGNSEYEYEITARTTHYVLYFKILLVLIAIGIFSEMLHLIGVLNLYSFITLLIIPSILAIKFILDWLLEFYVISPVEILHRKGILFIRKEIILLKNIEIIKLHQSIIGHLLNYGTVELYAPTISQTFFMYSVATPNEYIKALERSIQKFNSDIKFIRKN